MACGAGIDGYYVLCVDEFGHTAGYILRQGHHDGGVQGKTVDGTDSLGSHSI
jgi:hypothetical protein